MAENMSEMNSIMAKEGYEIEKEEHWQEDRRWMNDDVRASINGKQILKIGNIGR